MSTYKSSIFSLVLLLATASLFGQADSSVSTSICVQNAYTFEHVFDAKVTIETLNEQDEVLSTDTLSSAIYNSTFMDTSKRYKISVEKDGFYLSDTIVQPKVISRSKKQRLGIFLKPIVCFYIRGKVSNALNSTKIKQGNVLVKDLATEETFEAQIQGGYYEFCGQCAHKYLVSTIIDGHLEASQEIELSSANCFAPNTQEIKVNMAVAESYDNSLFNGDSVTIHEFTFVGKTVNLSGQGQQELNKLIQVMKLMPDLILSVAVHTDPSKSHRFNRLLSEKRAAIIEQKLIAEGISSDRFELIGKGEEEAIFSDQAKNQRACLWLRKKGE